jgi:formylglycine-generating enzyme required for sulfatase activity
MVSWFDATNYCGQLTEREWAAGRIPSGSLYRLPTEAEWEYSCRAWTSTRFSYGDDPGFQSVSDYAWYGLIGGDGTQAVGQKLPNPWGLYDMHGNVWEWCQDWLDSYPGGVVIDPQGLQTSPWRAARGGCWHYPGQNSRSAARIQGPPVEARDDFGFRVVLAPGSQ